MRTKKELESEELNDDMTELKTLLEKKGIEHTFKRHQGAGPRIKELIGFYPTGEWHIRIGDVSVIRGMASFGLYEAYRGMFEEPERFNTPEELLERMGLLGKEE